MTCVTYRPEHLHTSMGLRVLTPSQVYLESKCWDQASSNLDLGVTMMNRCPSQHACNTGVRNKLFCVQRGLGLSVTLKQLSVAKCCVQLFATSWTAAHQASLSFDIFQSLLRFTSIESVMLSNHLILCCPLFFLLSVFPSMRVFSLA